jgi:hypothetical protein
MSDRKQPTPIDEDEYERFVQFVKDVHGGTRGHLRTEIENALREYRRDFYGSSDELARIEDDVAQIKAMQAELTSMLAEADGGTTAPAPAPDVRTADVHTHTPSDNTNNDDQGMQTADPAVDPDHDPDDPPHAKSTTKSKVDWVEAEVRRRSADQSFSRPAVRKLIDDAWGFADRTADPMVETVVEDRLEAWVVPNTKGMTIAWGDSDRDNVAEDDADDVDAELDRLDDAAAATRDSDD